MSSFPKLPLHNDVLRRFVWGILDRVISGHALISVHDNYYYYYNQDNNNTNEEFCQPKRSSWHNLFGRLTCLCFGLWAEWEHLQLLGHPILLRAADWCNNNNNNYRNLVVWKTSWSTWVLVEFFVVVLWCLSCKPLCFCCPLVSIRVLKSTRYLNWYADKRSTSSLRTLNK